MQYGSGLGTVDVDIAMHAPFAGWIEGIVTVALQVDEHDVPGFQALVSHARRGDQEAIAIAHRDIAGAALIDATGVHRQATVDDLL